MEDDGDAMSISECDHRAVGARVYSVNRREKNMGSFVVRPLEDWVIR